MSDGALKDKLYSRDQMLAAWRKMAELERQLVARTLDCKTANERIELAAAALKRRGVTEYETLTDGIEKLASLREMHELAEHACEWRVRCGHLEQERDEALAKVERLRKATAEIMIEGQAWTAERIESLCDAIWPGKPRWAPTADEPQQDFYEAVVESLRFPADAVMEAEP